MSEVVIDGLMGPVTIRKEGILWSDSIFGYAVCFGFHADYVAQVTRGFSRF